MSTDCAYIREICLPLIVNIMNKIFICEWDIVCELVCEEYMYAELSTISVLAYVRNHLLLPNFE